MTGSGAGPAPPVDPRAALGWMRRHGERLRELLREEAGGDAHDLAPADDPAIRAHLRFAAAALEATAAPPLAAALPGLADDLPVWFTREWELYERHMATGAGAIALEQHLQFGARPGADPSLDAGLERRVRIGGWTRIFLIALEARLGPAADGTGDSVLTWLGDRQRELSRLILSLDREAKLAAARRTGADAIDPGILDEIGQAAVVQGHVRLLVEAVASTLAEGPAPA